MVPTKVADLLEPKPRRRAPLTRERVLRTAVRLADREGIEAVSMRRVGQALGVEAMSLYTHVKDKDDLLAGMADLVVGEVPLPAAAGPDWKSSMRATILAARGALLRHPWAARVIESRGEPGPATMAYLDGIVGIMRDGGFTVELMHHALHALGSRALGFGQDLFDDGSAFDPEVAASVAAALEPTHPNLAAIARSASHEGGLSGCDDEFEFGFALDLLLDGLDLRRTGGSAQR
jgi:AcrR family transcriptional regulator